MYLVTDEQTIQDLKIFSKRDTTGIYDIYNHTNTRGGEKLLAKMFREPLSDRDIINQRSRIIEDFCRRQIKFPFDGSLFDMAEKYLLTPELNERTANQGNLSEKDIHNGVTAVIELIRRIREFAENESVASIQAFTNERNAVMAILENPSFEPVLRENGKGKIAFAAIAAFDLLFRTRERINITKLLGYMYNLDVYISVAQVAKERQFVFPLALDRKDACLNLVGVYHPELKDPVPNDISLNSITNVLFLTGANMAGKSTFLRAVSTAIYIAHIGFPVPAREMKFSVMDGIFTTINLPDNLGIGASHFYAEVLRVKKIAEELHARRSMFVVFDEMFRGTNVKDAHEATVAITQAFSGRKNSHFIISSHIVEAGEQLEQETAVSCRYLPTKMNGHLPVYTYKLENGITGDRHGMIIIRNEGILDILKNGRKRSPKYIQIKKAEI